MSSNKDMSMHCEPTGQRARRHFVYTFKGHPVALPLSYAVPLPRTPTENVAAEALLLLALTPPGHHAHERWRRG